MEPRGRPQTLSTHLQSQNYFLNNSMTLFAFSTVLTFSLKVQKQRWANCCASGQQAGPSNRRSHYILPCRHSQEKGERNVLKTASLKNGLAYFITFNKSQPLSTHLFTILCDETRSSEALLSILSTMAGPSNSTCVLL